MGSFQALNINMARRHADTVFTFCGHIEGRGEELYSGYAVADSPSQAIDNLRELGVIVTAISSLTDVQQSIYILELIASRSPDIDQADCINVYPGRPEAFPPECVFSFVGHTKEQPHPQLQSGFIVAESAEFATAFLRRAGFVVTAIVSLADLRQKLDELVAIASDEREILTTIV